MMSRCSARAAGEGNHVRSMPCMFVWVQTKWELRELECGYMSASFDLGVCWSLYVDRSRSHHACRLKGHLKISISCVLPSPMRLRVRGHPERQRRVGERALLWMGLKQTKNGSFFGDLDVQGVQICRMHILYLCIPRLDAMNNGGCILAVWEF
ncbi:hypothetical protein ABZP36_032042 [Zizania latifolia]